MLIVSFSRSFPRPQTHAHIASFLFWFLALFSSHIPRISSWFAVLASFVGCSGATRYFEPGSFFPASLWGHCFNDCSSFRTRTYLSTISWAWCCMFSISVHLSFFSHWLVQIQFSFILLVSLFGRLYISLLDYFSYFACLSSSFSPILKGCCHCNSFWINSDFGGTKVGKRFAGAIFAYKLVISMNLCMYLRRLESYKCIEWDFENNLRERITIRYIAEYSSVYQYMYTFNHSTLWKRWFYRNGGFPWSIG